jgi:methyl-accepting chemotaxis protein
MADKTEIDKAVAAHAAWKMRLKTAIDSGTIDIPLTKIRVDNQCAFGQWLHGPSLTAADKNSAHYKSVKDQHAEFHKVAAQVAELALTRKLEQAKQMLSVTGEFTKVSTKLTAAMIEWKKNAA